MQNPWLRTTVQRIIVISCLTLFLISMGTLAYIVVEGFPFLDAFYMTVITLSTVGFGEVRPLDEHGRLITIGIILMGAGFMAFNLAYVSQFFLDVKLWELYRRRKLRKQLDQLTDHYIVCGYGQMGQIIVGELSKYGIPVVVVDSDQSLVIKTREKGVLLLPEDALEEENLIAAGILRAKGLVSVVNKDTDNVFIVLTARDLNKNLRISARAGTLDTAKRLTKAGADRVVSPFAIGALSIAHNIVRPTVTGFLELALSSEGLELSMEEISLPEDSEPVGRALMHSNIRSQYNLIVVAIKRTDGQMVYNPAPTETLYAGDTLVAIGPQENLDRFSSNLYGRECTAADPSKCYRHPDR